MLEDVNFFFVAACPWSSVPCERYILQTRVTVGSMLRQVTLLPSRPPLVKQFSGRHFFSRPAGFCFEKWLSGHEPRFEKVETIEIFRYSSRTPMIDSEWFNGSSRGDGV